MRRHCLPWANFWITTTTTTSTTAVWEYHPKYWNSMPPGVLILWLLNVLEHLVLPAVMEDLFVELAAYCILVPKQQQQQQDNPMIPTTTTTTRHFGPCKIPWIESLMIMLGWNNNKKKKNPWWDKNCDIFHRQNCADCLDLTPILNFPIIGPPDNNGNWLVIPLIVNWQLEYWYWDWRPADWSGPHPNDTFTSWDKYRLKINRIRTGVE